MSDLISRQMAIDAIEQNACNTQRIMDAVNNLPSVQPERKIGRWIKDEPWSEGAGMGESYGHYWKCDQCGNIVKGDWAECGDNFCSECGADMI